MTFLPAGHVTVTQSGPPHQLWVKWSARTSTRSPPAASGMLTNCSSLLHAWAEAATVTAPLLTLKQTPSEVGAGAWASANGANTNPAAATTTMRITSLIGGTP